MIPVWAAMAGLGVLQGMQKTKAQKKQNEQAYQAAQAQMKYSPWTGVTPNMPTYQSVDAFGNMVSGGLSGAATGMALGKGGGTEVASGGGDINTMAMKGGESPLMPSSADIAAEEAALIPKSIAKPMMNPPAEVVPAGTRGIYAKNHGMMKEEDLMHMLQGNTWGSMRA